MTTLMLDESNPAKATTADAMNRLVDALFGRETNVVPLHSVARRLGGLDRVRQTVLIRCGVRHLGANDTGTAIRAAERAYNNNATEGMAIGIGQRVADHLAAQRDHDFPPEAA